VTVIGVKNKAVYTAPGPAKISCKASETVSGLARRCTLTVHRTATAITWTATATSKAGLTTTVHGRATLTHRRRSAGRTPHRDRAARRPEHGY
jgi:hypothetical protein